MNAIDRNTEMIGCALLLQGAERCSQSECGCGQFATARVPSAFCGPNLTCDAHLTQLVQQMNAEQDAWCRQSPSWVREPLQPVELPLAKTVRRFNALLRNEA